MSIAQNIINVQNEMGRHPSAKLLVVTKNRSEEEMRQTFKSGITLIGENRIQEMEWKMSTIPDGISAHLIGHLQKNKAKKAVQIFDLIESVDSYELAEKISRESEKTGKVMPIFLQINISCEKQKYGFLTTEIEDVYKNIIRLSGVNVQGIMCIPKAANSSEEARKSFQEMRELHTNIIHTFNLYDKNFELSMGMSNDYKIALEEGSTLIRVGTKIFE